MEIDTGAAVSVMPLNTFHALFPKAKMQAAGIKLRTYSGDLLKPAGKVLVEVQYKDQRKKLPLYLIEEARDTLFGRAWINNLKMDWKEVKINSITLEAGVEFRKISGEGKKKLEKLLQQNLTLFEESIGVLNNFQARLPLKGNAIPKFSKARPLPYALVDKVSKELDRLEPLNIISKTEFREWATPIVPVLKRNGEVRICGDFKTTVNPMLQEIKYPLPVIKDIFARLAGGRHFTTLDISNAYLHLKVADEDKKILTINTHKGLYTLNRLLYGIVSAPSIWQRTIEQVLSGIPGTQVFLDDIIITAEDKKTHFERLTLVLERLVQHGLKLNKKKCSFFQEAVEYCGFKIDTKGLHKTSSKVKAVKDAPKPSNVSELKAFLGLVNYYGRFLKNLSTKLCPLLKLLHKGVRWNWNRECDAAFKEIKQEIASEQVLVHFDPSQEISLACNASPYGISAVLSHCFREGGKPIAFASRTLTMTEKNYSQIDKEALALVWGVKHFYQYLFGRRFVLVTDHKPLVSIFAPNKGISSLVATRMLHYALFLQGFQYDIKYKNTAEHGNADALSRLPLRSEELTENRIDLADVHELLSVISDLLVTIEQIAEATKVDTELEPLHKALMTEAHPTTPKFQNTRDQFALQQRCIMRGQRVIIPRELQETILRELHVGHFGIIKMKLLVRSFV